MIRKNALLAALAVSIMVTVIATPSAQAVKLEVAEIIMEINDTDGDAGIQIFLDGEDWDAMEVTMPDGTVLLNVLAEDAIAEQGLTEMYFESAEPSFDEQSLDEFLDLFPAGRYRYRGTTTEGDVLSGRAKLTHVIPEAPVVLSPVDGSVVNPNNVVIDWLPVPNPPGSKIVGYQVIVEKDQGKLRTFTADVNEGVTQMTVPAEFMQSGKDYKGEVIAIERSGNQIITEFEFETQ